jgi:hypothetical protein
MRLFIGKCIFSRDPAFRSWLKAYHATESVNSSLAVKAVTRLLERDLIPESGEFCFGNLSDEQYMRLEDDMFEEPPSGPEFAHCIRQRARQIRTVRIQDENHFCEAQRLFRNRYADRQVTIAVFPNDKRAVMNARKLDSNCTEVYLLEGQDSGSNDDNVQVVDEGEGSPELPRDRVESPLSATQFYVGRGETNLSANDFSELLAQNPSESFANVWQDRRARIEAHRSRNTIADDVVTVLPADVPPLPYDFEPHAVPQTRPHVALSEETVREDLVTPPRKRRYYPSTPSTAPNTER